ncbi:unnamed protein product [Zymoseptoria tritici ST99CH_1A5]|uniref:DUF7704 domain-containing protein n=1 Tax=Zymoseptoria tritici ST99CH_1A5 TaxID=1276529 RepID=A0A1Y6LY38_ZYMTR|nr:unnamed protein product [Zymoseptoria tritici ST99CH_1A5]
MAPSSPTPTKATDSIPYLYRFLLTSLEGPMAISGVLLALFAPGQYLSGITRETLTTTHGPTDFIYTQLAGAWLYIVFTELVIMRAIDDVRVWKYLCAGILCSDVLFTHSLAEAVGGWGEWIVLSRWTVADWVAAVTTFPFVMTRILIVLGIGLKEGKGRRA